MRLAAPSLTRQNLLCAAALGLVALGAPFPALQAVFHAALVLALAPRAGSPLFGALWALADEERLPSGALALLAGWMAGRWPLEGLKGWLARLAALSVLHALLVHGAVRVATTAHPWGWGWFWALLSVPAWGWLAWRLLHAGTGPGRR